jgi:8-oxo-dGTP diphosphatase
MSGSSEAAAIEIAVAVVEREGYYLVGRRPEGAALAGFWEFPGGKVEPAETPQQAAERECLEEAGLAVEVGAALSTVEHQYTHARVRISFFACRPVDQSAMPHPPFQWYPAAALAELPFPPANAEIVRQIVESHLPSASSRD